MNDIQFLHMHNRVCNIISIQLKKINTTYIINNFIIKNSIILAKFRKAMTTSKENILNLNDIYIMYQEKLYVALDLHFFQRNYVTNSFS